MINTGTTIVTFLMVFLIQNTQNRDAKAFHLKLDELIRALKEARTSLVDLEDLSDEELKQLQQEFQRLRERESGNVNRNNKEMVKHEWRGESREVEDFTYTRSKLSTINFSEE